MDPTTKPNPTITVGTTGYVRSGGRIYDEWQQKLVGIQGVRAFREMQDNDAGIGAALALIENVLRQVSWAAEPADGSRQSVDAADLLDDVMGHMRHPWTDLVSDAVSTMTYGWSLFEKTYLRRGDGRVGLQGVEIRAQESFDDWVFDKDGKVLGMFQCAAPYYQRVFIPMEKCVLFRLKNNRGSPEGRALAPETPIPTPDGWKTMGELVVGSKVFDEDGRIRYVVDRKEWKQRPRFRVTFNDGTDIIADANHQWLTHSKQERDKKLPGRIRTTQDMLDEGLKYKGITNFSVPWAASLDYPEQVLPVHPYYLGLWLGNGTSANASISCHEQDAEFLASILRDLCGYAVQVKEKKDTLGRLLWIGGDQKWDSKGPSHALRVLGVQNNKHIPAPYLRGSVEQRMDLLRGLMDSDGHVDQFGRCEFCNTNKNLVDGVAELVRSLGEDARITMKAPREGCQDTWLVKFTPTHAMFKLPRKLARIKSLRAYTRHFITNIEALPDGDTVCIEVDSPSHLFLAGKGMIPTHNSLLRNAHRAWWFLKRLQEIEAVGIERDLVGLPVIELPLAYLESTADTTKKALRAHFERMVQLIRRNEFEGVTFPSDTLPDGKPSGFKLRLLTTGGSRQLDISAPVQRYEASIARIFSTQFQLLGTGATGSWALSSDQTDMFGLALGAVLDTIQAQFQKQCVEELMTFNGIAPEHWPTWKHGDIEREDVEKFTTAIQRMTDAGLLTPDAALEDHVRETLGLPPLGADAEAQAPEPSTPGPELDGTPQGAEASDLQTAKAAFHKAMDHGDTCAPGCGCGA